MNTHYLLALAASAVIAVAAPSAAPGPPRATPAQDRPKDAPAAAPAKEDGWRPMFDGKSLSGWTETPFTARGKIRVEKGQVILGSGYMTGITWAGPFPSSNYEIRYEASRIEGSDFFAALTFPVRDSFCTFINGGWGGTVVGLSSLDSMDASENDTSFSMNFENGRWYAFRVRVTDETMEAWIDEERVIALVYTGRHVGLRGGEIDLSTPVGIASYSSVAALRKVEYRVLGGKE